MTIKFGFELEGFVTVVSPIENTKPVVVPPSQVNPTYPRDGFPGLVELRTRGGHSLANAYGQILTEYLQLPKIGGYVVAFDIYEGKFSRKEWMWMRKHDVFNKENVDVLSLYNEDYEIDMNTVYASLQINITNEISPERKTKDGETIPTRYGLLNIPNIIKNLDEEFKHEIKESKRTRGLYAIKDDIRLEYRSLPNCVFPLFSPKEACNFIERIEKSVRN